MLVLLEINTELADTLFNIKKGGARSTALFLNIQLELGLVLPGMVSEDTALVQVNSNHAVFILGANTVHYRCS